MVYGFGHLPECVSHYYRFGQHRSLGVDFSTPQVFVEQATAKLDIALTNRRAVDAGIAVKAVLLDP